MTDRIDAGKIFVWGHIGKDIKALDAHRMLAIAQQNPDYHLAIQANDEISAALAKLDKDNIDAAIEAIHKTDKLDNMFREMAAFLHESDDMLSTGSFMTGELAKRKGMMEIMEVDENGQ